MVLVTQNVKKIKNDHKNVDVNGTRKRALKILFSIKSNLYFSTKQILSFNNIFNIQKMDKRFFNKLFNYKRSSWRVFERDSPECWELYTAIQIFLPFICLTMYKQISMNDKGLILKTQDNGGITNVLKKLIDKMLLLYFILYCHWRLNE